MLSKHSLILLLFISGLVVYSGSINEEQPLTGKPLLSDTPHLQALLIEEMRALQQATNKIVSALPQGDWTTVATSARAIHDSFIFQQKLTAKDRDILHHHLPAEFIHLDQAFHQRAASLGEAAANTDAELSVYYLSRMLETCMQCHQQFATHRFPALKEQGRHAPHH